MSWHPVDLLALVLGEVLARAGVRPELVDDVIVGCGCQVGAQAGNIARRAALAAGWPDSVPGATVERQAASSAQAVAWAAQSIASGAQGLVVAGGVDVMSAVPLGANLAIPSVGKPFGLRLAARYQGANGFVPPGVAAETVARELGLARQALDGWALASMARGKQSAKESGHIVPVPVPADGKRAKPFRADEALGTPLTAKAVRAMSPMFDAEGVVTAANMAAEADGAAALLLAAPATATRLGLAPKAVISASAVAGCPPSRWPLASVAATEKLLGGLDLSGLDRYDVHESSAAAVLAWMAATQADQRLLNPDGGALATGSPIGAAGAGLFVAAVAALAAGRARQALVTVAAEGGVGTAALVEQP